MHLRNVLLQLQCSVLFMHYASAQDVIPPAQLRNNTFNSTYGPLSPSQAASLIAAANLSTEAADAILVAVNFERSNWAGSSAQLDPFYNDIPSNTSTSAPGSVLKIEQRTNTTLYTLPPNVALSRLLFTTKTFNGTVIPASAFVLWPWLPRRFPSVSGLPVVVWGHGTSGWSSECGPSHIRNLWYQYSAPYILALQGYVVVAPDYAGLGVGQTANGTYISHPYGVVPAQGNDLIFAAQAAQKAWPSLSKEFIVMGHSQGGGAAWAAAEILAQEPVEGYLGTVAASPAINIEALLQGFPDSPALGFVLSAFSYGAAALFPSFQQSDWLSEKGVRLANLLRQLQGCQSAALEIFTSSGLARPDWTDSWSLRALVKLGKVGGKKFAGPMLVLQGTADTIINPDLISNVVNATCEAFPDSQIEYASFEGVTHVPVMYAGQQVWLDWIADRFKRVNGSGGCQKQVYSPELATEAYQKELALVLQYPLYSYEVS